MHLIKRKAQNKAQLPTFKCIDIEPEHIQTIQGLLVKSYSNRNENMYFLETVFQAEIY